MGGYFKKKLNRVILEYLLHARMFVSTANLADEASIKELSDANCYLETASILTAFESVIQNEKPDYTE